MSADQTCYFSLISLLRFSLREMMDRLAFDKDQVKGGAIKAVRELLPTDGVWSTRCVEQWEEPKRKAVGGPVLCKYSDVRQSMHRLQGVQTPWKKEAPPARKPPLGQDSTLAHNGDISHNILSYFLSLSMTSHLFSPHTFIPAPEENPSRLMTGKGFVLAS